LKNTYLENAFVINLNNLDANEALNHITSKHEIKVAITKKQETYRKEINTTLYERVNSNNFFMTNNLDLNLNSSRRMIRQKKRDKFVREFQDNNAVSRQNHTYKYFKSNYIYTDKFLKMSNLINLSLIGKKELINEKYKMIINIKERGFTFPTKDIKIFTCLKISITPGNVYTFHINLIKTYLKITLISIIYLVIWVYIAIFVESIYKKYGDNIFNICVMPLISMLLVNLLIIKNIMLFISSIILSFFGKQYVNNTKSNILMIVIFKALVSPIALNHYLAILTYLNLG